MDRDSERGEAGRTPTLFGRALQGSSGAFLPARAAAAKTRRAPLATVDESSSARIDGVSGEPSRRRDRTALLLALVALACSPPLPDNGIVDDGPAVLGCGITDVYGRRLICTQDGVESEGILCCAPDGRCSVRCS